MNSLCECEHLEWLVHLLVRSSGGSLIWWFADLVVRSSGDSLASNMLQYLAFQRLYLPRHT